MSDAPRPEDPRNDPGIRAAIEGVKVAEHTAFEVRVVRRQEAEAAFYRAIEEWHRRVMETAMLQWAANDIEGSDA